MQKVLGVLRKYVRTGFEVLMKRAPNRNALEHVCFLENPNSDLNFLSTVFNSLFSTMVLTFQELMLMNVSCGFRKQVMPCIIFFSFSGDFFSSFYNQHFINIS